MPQAKKRWFLWIIGAVFVPAVLGCSEKPTPLHGKITCKGGPLTGAEVLFAPDVGTVGKPVIVQVDSNGEFTIPDAVVGRHKVRVLPTQDPADGGKPLACRPPEFVEFVVEKGVLNEFRLDL